MTVEAHKEQLGFQTEVMQILDLMIHSLYSNKEIFLRELISNASDAVDKLRFEALSDSNLYEDDHDLQIDVDFDREARTLTVRDNGIGMDRQEVIDNIGTIAKSGTREFFKSLTGDQRKDAHLIGQFGVGFYSSFIVADRVTLLSRRAGVGSDQGVRWQSDGQGSYSIETVDLLERGTEVTLHLRAEEDELLDGYKVRSIIRKYSDHITLPIRMPKQLTPKEKEEGYSRNWRRSTVRPRCGHGRRARSQRTSTTSSTATLDMILLILWRVSTARWKANTNTLCCSMFQPRLRLTSGIGKSGTVSNCMFGAYSLWMMPNN